MLFRVANLRPGARVLVHMAAGGVGLAVLQLCRTVPDVVTFGTASAAKHGVLREEGCTHPIDYRTEDYVARVRELTGGEGVDLVLDALGGRDWKRGLRLLRPVGQLIAYGFANLSAGERRSVRRLVGQLIGVPLLTPLSHDGPQPDDQRRQSRAPVGSRATCCARSWRPCSTCGARAPSGRASTACTRSRRPRRRTAASASAATSARSSSSPDDPRVHPIVQFGPHQHGPEYGTGRSCCLPVRISARR